LSTKKSLPIIDIADNYPQNASMRIVLSHGYFKLTDLQIKIPNASCRQENNE
jgi:hypothetical protein